MDLVIARWQIRISRQPSGPIYRPPVPPRASAAHLAQRRRRAQLALREQIYARLLLRE